MQDLPSGRQMARAPTLHTGFPPQRLGHPDGPRRYLLVFAANSTYVAPLLESGEMVIGRSEQADLFLQDRSVSRRHAIVAVSSSGEVKLLDLGSRNGVAVNGERVVGERVLFPGDEITVGIVTLVYQSNSSPRDGGAVWNFESLRLRTEEEIARALTCSRELTVLCINLGHCEDPEAAARSMRSELRAMDSLGWGSSDELIALLPETPADAVIPLAQKLLNGASHLAPEARAGYSSCPSDGCDVDSLLASARTAAQLADTRGVGRATEVQTVFVANGRKVVVADAAMKRVYALLARVAGSTLPVLIRGETGSGKEVAACAIHTRSPRSAGPLVTINCAAIQDTLIESELFGHEKGAFSGASATKPGRIEAADGGTLFLDEVGELSPSAQAKLLRVLDDRRVTRLGSVSEREVDIRVISATNRDLEAEVRAGRFREDLYFRLSGAVVWIPPLRDRRRELPMLAEALLKDACERDHRAPMVFTGEAIQALLAHDWPGNVRELRNMMEYLSATVSEQVVTAAHVGEQAKRSRAFALVHESGEEDLEETLDPDECTATGPLISEFPPPRSPRELRPLAEEVALLEKSRIETALEMTGGNQSRAAKLLSVPRRTFLNKIKKLGIRPRRGRETVEAAAGAGSTGEEER